MNGARIQAVCIVIVSSVMNPGVSYKTLTFFTHIEPLQNLIC